MEKIQDEVKDMVPDTKKGRRIFGIEMMAIAIAITGMGLLALGIFLYEMMRTTPVH